MAAHNVKAENNYFVRRSITVWLISCFTGLELTKQVKLWDNISLEFAVLCKQLRFVNETPIWECLEIDSLASFSSKIGDLPYSDTFPYDVSILWIREMF